MTGVRRGSVIDIPLTQVGRRKLLAQPPSFTLPHMLGGERKRPRRHSRAKRVSLADDARTALLLHQTANALATSPKSAAEGQRDMSLRGSGTLAPKIAPGPDG